MSTQVDPAHNLAALLLGTGEFLFSEGATSVADAQGKGFLDFGNVVGFQISPDNTTQEHTGSYRGTRRVDKRANTLTKVQYKLKCDEWNLNNLRMIFGGEVTTGFTQPAMTATNGSALAFNTVAAVIGRWYDILTAATVKVTAVAIAGGGTGYTAGDVLTVVGGTGGPAATLTVGTVSSGVITALSVTTGGAYTTAPSNPVSVTGGTGTGATFNLTTATLTAIGQHLRKLTTVTISTKTEGTDFVLDLEMGRIKFLTAQSASLVPVITCPVISATTTGASFGLIPGRKPLVSGFGKLALFDQHDTNKCVLNHEDFSCDISLESAAEINGTDFTEITLDILVTGTPGVVYNRIENQNAGIA